MTIEWGDDAGKLGYASLVCSVCGEEWVTACIDRYGTRSFETEECPVCLGAPREDE